MKGLIYPKESKVLFDLAFQLHNELGCGFKEKVYQDAFEVLLQENGVPYEREKHIVMMFHGVQLEHGFYYDFLCYGKIGVEIKACCEITGEFQSQLINYLHVGKHQLGLLVNFGTESLEYKWIPNRPNYYSNSQIRDKHGLD
jgi:GxxExxY protein